MNKFKLLYLNTCITILVVVLFLRTFATSLDPKKNVRLCMYSVLATNIVLVFAKRQGGSKVREMGDKIQ